MRRALPLAALLLGGCAFGRLRPGLTKTGGVVAVTAATPDEARKRALDATMDLFVAPGTPESERAASYAAAHAAALVGRVTLKKGSGLAEVDFSRVALALDKEGMLRPAGFSAKEPTVLLLVAEPDGILDLGVGPAADALRRHLSAYGLTAIDGRDSLNGLKYKDGTPESLVAAARKAGADWILVAAASVTASEEPASKTWQAKAVLVADAYKSSSPVPVEQLRAETSAVDVSSGAARGKALDEAGEDAAGKAAGLVQKSLGGRVEAAVFVTGGADIAQLRALVSALRKVEGVNGAYLASWLGEDGDAVVRVFLTGMKTDGLAARLLRRDPSLTLQSVEPDDGRLTVEVSRGKGS